MKGYTRIVAEKFATMSAQLVLLVDVYDALINEKCYKAAYSKEEAFHMKRACEKTRVFSFVLLLIVIIIAILHKKGYSSPYPIRMIL